MRSLHRYLPFPGAMPPVQVAMVITAVLLFLYTLVRADLLSFTHDESFTWIHFVQKSIPEILWFGLPSGNNHILNTLMIKGLSGVLGNSELVLRIPNLLGHLLYLTFSIILLNTIQNKWVRLFGFLLLNINPFLLDFFSLARGYGLSLGLLMAFLFFFYRWSLNKQTRDIVIALVYLLLAATANITLLPLFIAGWIYSNLLFILVKPLPENSRKALFNWVNINFIFIMTGLLLVGIYYLPVSKMIAIKGFDYGGTTGFWTDSIVSLVKKSYYGLSYRHIATTIFTCIWAVFFFLGFILIVQAFIRKQIMPNYPLLLLDFALFSLFAFGSVLQFRLLETPFLLSRTALILWPFIVLVPVCVLDSWNRSSLMHYVASGFSAVISILIIIHFFSTANLTHTLEWKYDADTRSMLETLNERFHGSEQPATVACTWLFEPSINFYRLSKEYKWLLEANREGPLMTSELKYVVPEDSVGLRELGYIPFRTFPLSGNVLFIQQHPELH